MIDRFQCLRHHTVVSGDHQNYQVGNLGSTGTHCSKRFVARGIQERYHPARSVHVIGANMLGDATRFAARDARTSNVIQQRSLAVIDMPHNCYDGRPWFCNNVVLLSIVYQERLGIIELRRFGDMTHLFDHDHRSFLVDHLIDGDHTAQLHQHLNHLGRFYRHFLREGGYGNGLRYQHLANNWLRCSERLFGNDSFCFVPPAPTRTRMPTLPTSTCIATCLQTSAFRRFVLPCIRLLGWLGLGGPLIRFGGRLVQSAFCRYFLWLLSGLGRLRNDGHDRFDLRGSWFGFLARLALALLLLHYLCGLAGD